MKPFATLAAPAVAIELLNVNTDQIFPARFIKKPRAPGYAGYLFHDLRFHDDGTERSDFPLNQTAYRKARILVGNSNFGCGSSREGAVYALQDYGFGAVIAPSLGDIFAANCIKNGLLPIMLPVELVAELRRQIASNASSGMTVNLAEQSVTAPDGRRHKFDIEPFSKHCLLQGLDEIALTLQRDSQIAAFEQRYRKEFEWLF